MQPQVSIDSFLRFFIYFLTVIILLLVIGATSGVIRIVENPQLTKDIIQKVRNIKSP